MGQVNTFSDHLFSEEALRRSSWSEKLKKTEEEVIRKKVIRKIVSSDTKASPGRTDAKVQICLQTQTSCRSETAGMDDCVVTLTAAVAVY